MVRQTGSALVTVDAKKALDMVRGLEVQIPRGIKLGTKKIASKYAEIYLNQMSKARITKWTGRSFAILRRQIINPIQAGRNEFVVVVPDSLIMLDQMRTHAVWLKKGSSIARWAKTKGITGFTMKNLSAITGQTEKGVIVKRHPWITEANTQARQFVRRLVKKEVNKKLRRKGKR